MEQKSMKTSIETINGKKYTVVWHDTDKVAPYDVGNSRSTQFTMQNSSGVLAVSTLRYDWIATALPALPRRPKPEDARLLYRYAAEGLEVQVEGKDGQSWEWLGIHPREAKITHALYNGKRVEIAIEGE